MQVVINAKNGLFVVASITLMYINVINAINVTQKGAIHKNEPKEQTITIPLNDCRERQVINRPWLFQQNLGILYLW